MCFMLIWIERKPVTGFHSGDGAIHGLSRDGH